MINPADQKTAKHGLGAETLLSRETPVSIRMSALCALAGRECVRISGSMVSE
jgi:hypothetical protein